MTARNGSRAASELLRIADPTVAMAVDLAATVILSEHDRELAKLASLEALALMWGGKVEPEIKWDTVEEL